MSMTKKEIEEFVEKYKEMELDPRSDPLTTWENNLTDRMLSPVVLNRYYSVLKLVNLILYIILMVLVLAVLSLSIKLIFFTDFEMFIFQDGTDFSCILNPKTGVVSQNAK